MHTLNTFHTRALRACGGAAVRAIDGGSFRLASLAEQTADLAERAYARHDLNLLQRAIRAAAAIGRRVRNGGAK